MRHSAAVKPKEIIIARYQDPALRQCEGELILVHRAA
jgi:hypothetical protein